MTTPTPAAPAAVRGRRRAATGRARVLAVLVGPLVLVGLVAGVIWPFLLPDVQMQMTTVGPYPVSELDASGLMAMDGWFAVLAGVGGLLTGSVLATVLMRHGWLLVFGLLVGAVLAAAVMLTVGSLIGNGELLLQWEPDAAPGAELLAPVQLHAYGVALVWPVAVLSPVLPLALFAWPIDEVDVVAWEHGERGVGSALTSSG